MASTDTDAASQPPHLAVVGGGVAGCAAASWAASRGAKVTLFNAGLPLGGTCIHVGTFPARLMMSAATAHHRALHPRFSGLDTDAGTPDLAELNRFRRRTGDRLRANYHRVLTSRPNVEIITARASFVDELTLRAGDRVVEADRVLLTPGSHSQLPALDGIDDTDPLQIASVGELDEIPERLVFVEINDVAVVYAQLLARLGTDVTVVTEADELFADLRGPDVTEAMKTVLADDAIDVAEGVQLRSVESTDPGIRLRGRHDGRQVTWSADEFVVVDHHRPRIDDMKLDCAGVDISDDGLIVIDEALQTTHPHIYAAGDAIGTTNHAYAAAYDAILAARNAIYPSRTAGHTTAVPFAIYTDPEFAGVGWSEYRARRAGFDADTALCPLEDVPAACALGQSRGYVKLIRDRRSDQLVGARIFAPHAAELIMELALAVRHGFTAAELGTVIHPPISLGEAIGRAARNFAKRPATRRRRPSPPADTP